ncbi:hypothetical protein [Streptomyces sp. NPDC052107]|uniref:hypothetical protein n=1 Tax=Streptomyces sp. NPDC052107 TaxID=3155632 RepID=UPI00342EF43C
MTAVGKRAEPWQDRDVLMVCGTTLAGLALLVTAWFGAGGTASVVRQTAWLNLAVAGFALAAIGQCLWLLRARRAVGERRIALISLAPQKERADSYEDSYEGSYESSYEAKPLRRTSTRLVRAAGMVKLHRPDCPLLVGKDVVVAAPEAGELCGVCAP